MAQLQMSDMFRHTEEDPTLREKEPAVKQVVRKKYKFIIRDLIATDAIGEAEDRAFDPYNVYEITGTKNEVTRRFYDLYFESLLSDFTDREIYNMIEESCVFCKNVELSNQNKKNIWIQASLYDFLKMIVNHPDEIEPILIRDVSEIIKSYEAGGMPEEDYDINDCKDALKEE